PPELPRAARPAAPFPARPTGAAADAGGALAPRTRPAALPVRQMQAAAPDRVRAAVSAAAARPETVRAAARGALLAGAGALLGRALGRRGRRRR
ncbi:MAG TPA: hypothetical protein VF545_07080, partial [Thermoleophilaceae bacterium]